MLIEDRVQQRLFKERTKLVFVLFQNEGDGALVSPALVASSRFETGRGSFFLFDS